jgi:hypothetical protein
VMQRPITGIGSRAFSAVYLLFLNLLIGLLAALIFPLPPAGHYTLIPVDSPFFVTAEGSRGELAGNCDRTSVALPPESAPLLEDDGDLSARVVLRLVHLEAREVDPCFQVDYRIARLTVALAARGESVLCAPHVAATYTVLGLHPDRVWPAIVARRKAQLGADYSTFYDRNGNWKSDPVMLRWNDPLSSPKKPVRSVERQHQEGRRRLRDFFGEKSA